jgi:hypothetical protein
MCMENEDNVRQSAPFSLQQRTPVGTTSPHRRKARSRSCQAEKATPVWKLEVGGVAKDGSRCREECKDAGMEGEPYVSAGR